MMLLKLIPDAFKLPAVFGAGLLVGAGGMFFPAKWVGQSEGKQLAATASLVKSVEVLRERNIIDAEVGASSAAALCGSYGLSVDETAECVRRVQEADAISGNNGDDPSNGSPVCGPGGSTQSARGN